MRRRFKNYRITRELSSSLWTKVYKAIHEPLDRPVSLKILNSEQDEGEELAQRFEREAKICANLVHPNLVRLFDYGRWRGEYFIVQEWVDGTSLKELLKSTRLPWELGLYIISNVAKGLSYAHSQGVTHRDIKPGNILIGKDGGIKITDFGLACSIQLPEITLEDTFLGTPAYSAPEQIKGLKVDRRADIFSLGVVSYEVLTGKNPFAARTYSEVLERICHFRQKPAWNLNSSIPQGLSKIVNRMLAKKPGNRYLRLEQLLGDLEALTQDQALTISQDDLAAHLGKPGKNLPQTRRPRRIPAWVYPVFAGALATTVLFLVIKPYLRFEKKERHEETAQDTTLLAVVEALDTPMTDDPSTEEIAGRIEDPVVEESFLRFQIKPWARIYIDGKYWETTPTDRILTVEPGRHKLTLTNEYLTTYEQMVEVKAGETLAFKMDLLANASWLKLSVRPWGEVYIDGNHISTTPLAEPITLAPGRHQLKITHPTLPGYDTTIEAKPGDTLTKSIALDGNI
ncbi:serine/threonine protein kinase [candidate division WOR-3 bacterium]|nr:serine/threonine protein kinase [candidate division WOR-3 bacterium]